MYLFQHDFRAGILTHYGFTFHYVSISTKCGYDHFAVKYLIYIPLCIYFNPNNSFGITIEVHLHSTMYLFQRVKRYSFMWICLIYIPLCIYFNLIMKLMYGVGASFTFHYVSISTMAKTTAEDAGTNLHSTMYLFQPSYKIRKSPTRSIYIPLCIYFNSAEVPTVLWPL